MTQALYRKWRSQTFEEVVGQEHIMQTLRNALREDRVAHAYLFSGPRGTGKTSTARILAKALNCTGPEDQRPCNQCPTCIAINEGRMLDLIEIDAASNNSVEDIRELRDKVGFRPSEGRYKIYIIDEVHMLSNPAFNALLKTLEEPPPHTRFVLATTEPHKIPATVLSRCQRFDFRRIPAPEIAAHLRHIVDAEQYAADDEALMAIAQSAQGCMRDAISLLDQMFSYGADKVTLAQVQQVLGAVSSRTVIAFADALAAKDAQAGLKLVQQLALEGASLNEFAAQVVEYLRGVLLMQMTDEPALLADWPGETAARMREQANQMALPGTLHAIKLFSEAAQQLKGGYQPQLPLELALIEAIRGEVAPQPAPAFAAAAPPATSAPAAAAAPTISAPAAASPPAPAQSAATQPDAAPPAEQDAEGEPPPLDEAAVRKLRSRWQDFLKVIQERCGHEVPAALRTVRDIAIGDQSIAFAFGINSFSRDMVAKPETLKIVTTTLSEFLGRKVLLECQMGDHATLPRGAGGSAGGAQHDGPDPLVEYAVSELGAQVIDTTES